MIGDILYLIGLGILCVIAVILTIYCIISLKNYGKV